MMIENSAEKKRLFYMIVLVLTLIAMIIGATLAYFRLFGSQKEEGTVLYTGTLQITYIDGVYIKDPELFPMSNVTFNTYDKVYRNNFMVSSYGTLDQEVSIDMEISTNEFTPGTLKYAIFNSAGEELSRGNVPLESGKVNLTNNLYLQHNSSARYTLIIWWDSNAKYNQKADMGSIISGKFNIYAKQIRN